MSDKFQILFEKTYIAQQIGKIEIEKKYFNEVIAIDQTALEAWCGIAECLRSEEKYAETEEYFLNGLKHQLNHIHIWLGLIHFLYFLLTR